MQPPKHITEKLLQDIVDKFLIPRFMMLGMNATGKWLKSLEVVVQDNKGIIKGAHYTEQLVFGRKPQPKTHAERARWAYGMANFNNDFKAWLRARGLTEYGFQVAYNLDKEGTTWYKKGGSNLLEVLEEPATVRYVYERIGSWYQLQIANELRRYAKEKLEAA